LSPLRRHAGKQTPIICLHHHGFKLSYQRHAGLTIILNIQPHLTLC
jgi:hypothetical protein